jgi:molybdate transport system permease protein
MQTPTQRVVKMRGTLESAQSPIKTRTTKPERRNSRDVAFLAALGLLASLYIILIIAMVVAEALHTTPGLILQSLRDPNVRFAIRLTLITCFLSTILCLWVAVPLGYLMSRFRIPFAGILDAIIDIPIVLPPLVVGLCLLILFSTPMMKHLQRYVQITYAVPSIIIAQSTVACAFAARTMRVTFEGLSPRTEQIARTLGASRAQVFWRVSLPEARHGILAAATLAWARSLGEFGPILVFSGATRMRTEVLSTSVFLQLSIGNLEGAVAVSLLLVGASIGVMILLRVLGADPSLGQGRTLSHD